MNLTQFERFEDLPPLPAYLDALGVLEYGTEDQIQQAKAIYRRVYKRLHRRMRRKVIHSVSLSLSHQAQTRLSTAAQEHEQPLGIFIIKAALAYCDQRFVIPNEDQVDHIEATLVKIYSHLRRFSSPAKPPSRSIEMIGEILSRLEIKVEEHLRNPDLLLDQLEQLVSEDPAFKQQLLARINRPR